MQNLDKRTILFIVISVIILLLLLFLFVLPGNVIESISYKGPGSPFINAP